MCVWQNIVDLIRETGFSCNTFPMCSYILINNIKYRTFLIPMIDNVVLIHIMHYGLWAFSNKHVN